MAHDDDDDDDVNDPEGYGTFSEAVAETGLTQSQLRSLVAVGVVRTLRSKTQSRRQLFCLEDVRRVCSMRSDTPGEELDVDKAPTMVPAAEVRALVDGFERLLRLAMAQTKQAQDHERMMTTANTGQLKELAAGQQGLVTAVLKQNELLVQRANDGDAARLQFVQAAEVMLKDQRAELRLEAENNRRHELRQQMWNDVRKAAPQLLEGLKETVGGGRLAAAERLKQKIDPATIAGLIKLQLLPEDQIEDLCTALDLDRAELDKLNKEADAVAEAEAAEPEQKAEAAE